MRRPPREALADGAMDYLMKPLELAICRGQSSGRSTKRDVESRQLNVERGIRDILERTTLERNFDESAR